MDIRNASRPKYFVLFDGHGLFFTRTYVSEEAMNSDLSVYSGYIVEKYMDDGNNFVRV